MQCYYRFDKSFTGPSQFSHQIQGNLAHCPSQPTTAESIQMGAMLATPETVADSSWYADDSSNVEWYPDSGATNHLTADYSNLMSSSEFCGTDQVHMGNGKGLSIKHIGSSTFSSPFVSSKSLTLKHLLHVPEIRKNLLSVSKFVADNQVFF